VEQTVRDAENRRNAAFSSVRNSPGALVFGDTRTSDDHSPRRTGPLNRRVERLVKRSRHRIDVAARPTTLKAFEGVTAPFSVIPCAKWKRPDRGWAV